MLTMIDSHSDPIGQKGMALWEQMKQEHPEFDSLPDAGKLRLWREDYVGVPNPKVPSRHDCYEEATCLKCEDAKWIHPRGPDGKPDYSQTIPCSACSDYAARKMELLLKQSGVPESKRDHTFANFILVPGVGEALDLAWRLASGEADFKFLLVYGGVGNGKTHLGYATVIETVKRGLNARFVPVGSLMSDLRRAMDRHPQGDKSPDDIIDGLKQCDLLVLDDLGVEQGTPWQQSQIHDLIDYRYREEKQLLIATNLDQKDLSERLLSRFKDRLFSRRVLNTAPDYRPKKREPSRQ